MKIVVLGGTGFIGKAVALSFIKERHDVTTISKSPTTPFAVNHTHINNSFDDEKLLPIYKNADFIFHLATTSTPNSSAMRPSCEGLKNILPTLGLLEMLQKTQDTILIFVSSGGAVYDNSVELPFNEGSKTNPKSHYGAGKLAIEQFIQAYSSQTGNSAVILRPSNIYGPGQSTKLKFGIIPTLIEALTASVEFHQWGSGDTQRDYLYINDFVDLCRAIVSKASEILGVSIYNASTGRGHSISNICTILEKISGAKLEVTQHPSRTVDANSVIISSELAHDELGWTARTELSQGLKSTWNWHISRE